MDTDVESEHKRQRKDRVQGRPAGTHLASPAPSSPSGPGRQGLSKWDPARVGLSSWASWVGEGRERGWQEEAGRRQEDADVAESPPQPRPSLRKRHPAPDTLGQSR